LPTLRRFLGLGLEWLYKKDGKRDELDQHLGWFRQLLELQQDTHSPEEFLESLRDADIIRNPASLLYVQALKFLQTKAMPESARRASRDRRVRRVTGRKS